VALHVAVARAAALTSSIAVSRNMTRFIYLPSLHVSGPMRGTGVSAGGFAMRTSHAPPSHAA
jgi:hypothetical protein